MTTKPAATSSHADEYAFPRALPKPPPKPFGMQQEPFASEIRSVLRRRFARRTDALVAGEGYLCHDTRNRVGWLVPDCIIAFGVDPEAIRRRNGYVISEVGRLPDFVLEIASESTGRADFTRKRAGYARYGVAEYWRFDASGGDYHDLPLAGDALVDGAYQPIALRHEADGVIRGHSAVLELDLCWDAGRLRFYDPVAGRYLNNLDEAENNLDEAENRADEAENNLGEAENRADEAENRADEAENRADEAEAEARRLRELLRRLQSR